MSEPLRVVVLLGGLPADPAHLELLAGEVELTVYRSAWLPAAASRAAAVPSGLRVRDFAPVVRTDRGHLAFVYRGLHRALTADDPHVVHVVSEPWGLLAVQAAAWTRGHPTARLVLHGCDTIWHHGGRVEQWVRRVLIRRTLPGTAAAVAESDKALALARAHGLPPGSDCAKIHTNPRDAQLFRPPNPAERAAARTALGLRPDAVTVGLLGRLVPEKGVRLFLDAARVLLDRGFAGQFVVAGDGPLREEVAARASADVLAAGRLSYPGDVLTLFRALDVLACPSLTTPSWEDQGPRSLLEGMMCGCVPVGTPTGAIPDMMAGRGVVAESTSVPAVAAAIEAAARSVLAVEERERIASWAAAQFSAAAVARQLRDLWNRHGPADTAEPGPRSEPSGAVPSPSPGGRP